MSPDEIKRIESQWKSDVDLKLDKLVAFVNKHEKLLDTLLEREVGRAKLRQAIVEKTLTGLVWAAFVVMGTAILAYAKDFLRKGP